MLRLNLTLVKLFGSMLLVKRLIGQFVGWFKIRFIFSDKALLDTLAFFERVDRERLNDEKLWAEVQYNYDIIYKELDRRGY